MLLLIVFYLQKLWNLIVVILCKVNTRPQVSHFFYMNAIAFKCIFGRYDQKSVSKALHSYFTSVVEYYLNLFPCHRHVFVKIVNKQISHAL